MSFILDALKKSEAERQRQAGPALLEMRVLAPQRRLPAWAIAVGVLLLINVVVLAWFAWRRAPAAATAVPAPVLSATIGPAASGSPAAAPAPAAPAPAAFAASTIDPATAAAEVDNPADLLPAVNSAPVTARPVTASVGLQTYAELSGKLPELRLDLHVFAVKPAERYAFINMHKVREGEVTPEGVRVTEITNEGVVLDYRGTEFLLGHQ
jgi:general secretion pathway protein B